MGKGGPGTMKVVGRRLLVGWGLALYLLIPTAVVSWLINPELVEIGIYAAAVGALGTLMHQRWAVGAAEAGAFAALGMLAALLSPYPAAGGALMALCGLALGLSGRWALHYSTFLIPILLISILIDPVPATAAQGTVRLLPITGGAVAWSILVVLVVAGGLAVLLCLPILHRLRTKGHRPLPLPRLPTRSAWSYGLVLAVCLGGATWWVLADERAPDASWLLLTLVLLLQPSAALTTRKATIRGLGTLAGSVIALLVALIPVTWVVVLVTLLLTSAAIVAVFDSARRYWLWVVLWTPSIILLTSTSANVVRTAEYRVGATLVAAAVALGLALGVQYLHPRTTRPAAQSLPTRA